MGYMENRNKMLQGKTIAITRSEQDSKEFISLMNNNNAKPITLPTIQLVSRGEKIVDEFLNAIETYKPNYSVFMSSKAVKLLFDTASSTSTTTNPSQNNTLTKYHKLQLAISNTIVVAVGPKTRDALLSHGIQVNHMPKTRFSSVGVGEIFTKLYNSTDRKVIIPRSGASTPFLKNLLNKIGLDVKELYLYDVCAFKDTTTWNEFRDLFSQSKIDGIIFTSASSVRAFFEIMSKDYPDQKTLINNLARLLIVAIGPFTSDELEKFHIKNIITSQEHTVPGAFNTIKNSLLA
jgi:uroporphyrinogen-III synthase